MKKNKKNIFLTYYSYPCDHPVLTNVFAKEIAKSKCITWIMQGDTSKGRTQKWYYSNVLICKKLKKNYSYFRLINKFLKICTLITLFRLLIRRNTNIVFLRDLPITALLLSPFKKILRYKIYFQYSAPLGEINIFYYHSITSLKRYWYLLLGTLNNFFINKAINISDLVFPISEFHKDKLSTIINENKMVPLTMGVDLGIINGKFFQVPMLEQIKKSNFLITYFGTLNVGREPLFLFKTFSKVVYKIPNCKLIIMGKTLNSWEDKLMNEWCSELKIIDDVIFTGYLDRYNLIRYLKYCDLSISPIPPLKHFIISSPTKVYESLGCGVPVVANREIHEQAKVIRESGGGVLSDYNIDSFSEAIVSLLNDDAKRRTISNLGKTYVERNYDYKKIAANIKDFF